MIAGSDGSVYSKKPNRVSRVDDTRGRLETHDSMLHNGKHIINNIIQIRIRRCIPPAPAHQIVRHGVDGGGAMVRQLESGKQPETRQPLQWYVAHTHNVLSVYDSRLATSDITTIHRMSRDQQRHWVKHLDIARDTHQ